MKFGNNWSNELWCGDNLEVLKNMPDESVDLIYIDPPFYSNKGWEIIWGNGAEKRAFDDRWRGGIEHYVDWMVKRLKELHRILKPTGSIYLHLDWHAVHYLKVEMDKIFGYDNFQREVIWRIGWVSGYKTSTKNWIRNHDSILFYTKGKEFTFNKEFIPYPKDYVRRDGKKPTGRGFPMEDTWNCHENDKLDSIMIKSFSKEKIGYPTQKPEALLERIIKASSNEGDIVLDAFCGCGTTIAVAEKLNRKWIGIDVSPVAVKVMTERLINLEKKMGKDLEDFITYGLPEKTIAHLRKMTGFEFEEFIIQQIDGKASPRKVHDYGLDGYNKDGIPIQMKNSERIGRNVVDNFNAAIRRVKSKKGQIYAISFGRGAHEEAARLKREDGVDIELIDMNTFLIEKYGDYTHRK